MPRGSFAPERSLQPHHKVAGLDPPGERLLKTRQGVLYPLLVVAAIAVILFSLMGIAAMLGYLPIGQSRGESQLKMQTDDPYPVKPRGDPRDVGGDSVVPGQEAPGLRVTSPVAAKSCDTVRCR